MNKLIKITLGIALAFLIVGCESSEAKSSSNSTQARQVEQQQVATQTNQMSEEQKYKILATGALEYIQNTPFKNYQDTTFKQMLEKWTNFCASVSWDIARVTALGGGNSGSYGDFLVTAYCEIKDFGDTKEKLQSYYTQKKYVDFSFKHINHSRWELVARDFFGGDKLYPLIPSGEQLIREKMNENQKRKVFDYIMDKIYMPLSQAINESTKIYLAYPFRVNGKCENNDSGEYKCQYKSYNNVNSGYTELFTSDGFWQSVYMYYDRSSDYGVRLYNFRLAFEVNDNKLLVNNLVNRINDYGKIDMAELMYFNKSIDAINLIEDKFIMISGDDYGAIDTNVGGKMLSTPAIKKILYDKQEQEQFFKDFAAEIVKIYSESN